jgi:predicted ATPase/serine phosphatase RsbU (regulator of sigma subunit)/tRNA A-37 threonylcarbamoyl transferase component Bud32
MQEFGNYKIEEKIHETKYTEIYRALKPENGISVILKILKNEFPSPELIARLRKEYQILSQVDSPHVIKVYSLEQSGNHHAIVVEDIGGISLKDHFKGKLELAEFFKIAILMVKAIEDVHKQNIIHKDINPSNFIFNPTTNTSKLIDFGISTTFTRENNVLENPNILEGTLNYISPEQTGRMNRSIDYRTDFYSLGITFYEFLTGKLPFDFSDPMELVHSHIARQPIPPSEFDSSIPIPVSDLIMKLISKTAEERYLSSFGLRYDLEILSSGILHYQDTFPSLATKDASDKFQIPQKLYGREKEIETLLSAFERVSESGYEGGNEFLLVSGYSGIGKSSLVSEIYKPITEKRGFFITGKFDQFQRNIPYSAIVNAFRGLIRQILTEREEILQIWKEKLLTAFDSKGQVVADVIPEIELIVGKQPLVPELPSAESRNRFNMVFQDFIRVFCSKNHPLVIFLDDLQWADSATLKLIELIMTDSDINYLFLIGAYRDNEVNSTHPFSMMLDDLKKNSVLIQELSLTPLHTKHIEQIVADTLHSTVEHIRPIAALIENKTGGNPFFVNEFLKTLYSENLLRFEISDSDRQIQISPWKWNIEQIKSKGLTDNVVHLLVGNLRKLSDIAQDILQLASCIGNQFDLRTISIISEIPEMQIFEDLLEPIQTGLVFTLSKFNKDLLIMDCKFAHDRVQQAAYSLIDESSKKFFHLKIGRLLLANTPKDLIEEKIFDIVNQLNQALDAIDDEEEKLTLAELNLIAGRKAKNSNAESTALKHFTIGLSILPENSWKDHYNLSFQLHKETAYIEYTTGNFERGKELFATTLKNAISNLDKAEIFSIEMNLYMTTGNFKRGIESGLNALKILGLDLPGNQESLASIVEKEANEVRIALQDRNIPGLIGMADVIDKEKIAIMQLLVDLWALAYLDANYTLLGYTVLKITNMSLESGNTALSAFGYVTYGLNLAAEGKYKEAFELGSLALSLNDKFNNSSLTGKINNLFCHAINPYNRHLKTNIQFYQASYHACMLCGDLTYGGWALFFIIWTRLETGENLLSVSDAAEQYLPSVEKINDLNMTYAFKIVQRLLWNFLGRTPNEESFSDELLTEEICLKFWQTSNFDHGINWFSYSKAQLLYIYDKPEMSYDILKSVEDKIASNIGFFPIAKYNFYFCLSVTAIYHSKKEEEKKHLFESLEKYQAQIAKWAENCKENFLHKYLLIEAEKMRLIGNVLQAQNLYDESIELANKNGFTQDEALGKKEFADIYLKRAHYAYTAWGAAAKVKLLEKKYPSLAVRTAEIDQSYFSGGTIISRTTNQQNTRIEANISLDFVSIMKASQIISGEIILEKLLSSLMKILAENAGAERGFLLLEQKEKLLIETSWNSTSKDSTFSKSTPIEDTEILSPSIVNYVNRTKQDLVLEDVTKDGKFKDNYITKNKPKSVLCIPLLNQGKLIGIVYLENTLTSGAFTKDRIEILKMLSAQAAISIENARLYSNLENVTKEKTRVTTEMEIARDIQTSLLPKTPKLSDFDVATYMLTADLVGGDYFDIINTEGREWFLIGDVSGHGVTAGLIMMMTQTAIHTILNSMETKDPSILLSKINQVITSNIHKMKLNKYMTLTLFLKDTDGMIYYSGMHQDLLLYQANKKSVKVIETNGSWIGYYDLHDEFQVDNFYMESGDVLLLFTDGVTESINAKKEMFEINGLIRILETSGNLSALEIKNKILGSLTDFKTEDDITFMVCKRN